jgi:hypothetical protein
MERFKETGIADPHPPKDPSGLLTPRYCLFRRPSPRLGILGPITGETAGLFALSVLPWLILIRSLSENVRCASYFWFQRPRAFVRIRKSYLLMTVN